LQVHRQETILDVFDLSLGESGAGAADGRALKDGG
jgi:hypothetical protein